jgi:hypothetical protein
VLRAATHLFGFMSLARVLIHKMATLSCLSIVKKELANTNQNSRIEWRREAPPLDSGVLCPKQNLLCYIAVVKCIRPNQNPNSVRRRVAPPHTVWVLFANKNGDSDR